MITKRTKRVVMWVPLFAMVAVIGACGASEEPTAAPATVPTAEAPQQPATAATAIPAATAMAAATAVPVSTFGVPPTAIPAGEPRYGGIAVISTRDDLVRGGDPMRSTTITNGQVLESVYGMGNLTQPCRDNSFDRGCPFLAESFEVNSDFTRWSFTIRDDVLWHDGTPMTPQHLKWWMELAANGYGDRTPANNAVNYGEIGSIEILDGNKLVVNLSVSIPTYLITLALPHLFVSHPQHLAQPEIDGGNPDVALADMGFVGMGPFKFEEYAKGSVFSVRRFDRYFEKDAKGRQLPYLDGIDFPVVPDREAQMAAFRAGRLDATGKGNRVWWLPEQIEIGKRAMGDDIVIYPVPSGYRTIAFNTTVPGPWQDIRVRKAISMALDRWAGARALYGDESVPVAIFFPGSPFVNPDYLEWPGYNEATKAQDVAEAKRLLTEAGFPDGFQANLTCRSGAWVADCEFMAEQMRTKLNIDVTLVVVDSATLTERQCSGQWEWITGGGGAQAAFPETTHQLYASETVNSCGNMGHDDPKVDEFFEMIKASTDAAEKATLAQQAEKYILQEKAYTANLYFSPYPFAARSYLKNLLLPGADPRDYLDYSRVWLEK